MRMFQQARKLEQITMPQQNSTNMWRIKNLCKLHAVFDNWNRLTVIEKTEERRAGPCQHAVPHCTSKKQQSPKPYQKVGSGLFISLSQGTYTIVQTVHIDGSRHCVRKRMLQTSRI